MTRTVAYCRVSTDKEDQINSLESQKRFFREYISRNPEWKLTEIYVDEGITGTSTKKRHAFLKMLKDAQNHKFDLILTKEISRFARNTLDSIYYTRKLKELGIGIIFVNDNINTLDGDGELRLTIMASIAQEESRKTSERVKWGQKRSMERGVVFGRDLLGFYVHKGKLYINEEGAKIVKLIFHKFVKEGKGTHVIARELTEAGISPMHGFKWHGSVILKILKNEKYCGDLIQKKTYTPDYLKQEKKYNKGEEELICIRGHHQGIISRELFEEAQAILRERKKASHNGRKYSNCHCFSGIIRCGTCGHSYVLRTRKKRDGGLYRYWRCYEAVQHGRIKAGRKESESMEAGMDKFKNFIGCNSPTLKEENIKEVLQYVIGNLNIDRQAMITNLVNVIRKYSEDTESIESELNRIEDKIKYLSEKKQRLIDLYLSKEITKEDFNQVKCKYELEITQLEKIHEDILHSKTESALKTQNLHMKRLGNTDNSERRTVNWDVKGLDSSKNGKGKSDGKNQTVILERILKGDLWNDAFYSSILEKILVEQSEENQITLTVYLKYMDTGLVCEMKES